MIYDNLYISLLSAKSKVNQQVINVSSSLLSAAYRNPCNNNLDMMFRNRSLQRYHKTLQNVFFEALDW